MSRTLTSGMLGVTTADVVRPAYFVRMVFDSGESPNVLNLWSGVGDLAYGGNTYTGVGDLLSISSVAESSDISATGINVAITGIKSSFIVIAKDHEYQGRPLSVSLGAFDVNGALIADPLIVFSGFMDTMTIAESGSTSTITISVENKLIAFERSRVRRYTAEDQKIDHPTDKGFEFVTAIVEKEIIWGRSTGTSGGSSGSSGHRGGAGNNGNWNSA
tara:strand:+ start:309 stop:959 length:651 start_codon:yes stop_codon:yes gene_type:complete